MRLKSSSSRLIVAFERGVPLLVVVFRRAILYFSTSNGLMSARSLVPKADSKGLARDSSLRQERLLACARGK